MKARATKIVATIGPASSKPEVLKAMIEAGVNVVRLNFSHGTVEEHLERARFVRAAAAACGKEVAIMADLQGPKIRIGKFEQQKIELEVGQAFVLDAECTAGNHERVGLDYPNLARDVRAEDILLLNDGLIRLRVTAVKGQEIHTVVQIGGELSNNKGINRLGGGLSAPALTAKDMEDIKTAIALQADYIAVSFPKNKTDIEMARQLALIAAADVPQVPHIIAKIERAEAIPALEEILSVSDGIMVARGDLAVEVGVAAVPSLQKHMITMARSMNKTVITATQMMESMVQNPVPTRAEVSDVANAVLDGTDAVMLSAETAAGRFPVETVQAMAAICLEAEKTRFHEPEERSEFSFKRIDQSIANAALFTAQHLSCRAICALTESGSTALWMSRHPIQTPIYALTPSIHTQRRLALYRNVHPLPIPYTNERDNAVQLAEEILLQHNLVQKDDFLIVTVGEPMGSPGGTNTLKIIQIG